MIDSLLAAVRQNYSTIRPSALSRTRITVASMIFSAIGLANSGKAKVNAMANLR